MHTHELRGQVDERPDIITASLCHHYMSREDRAESTKVCYDLLPPGGAFVTFENIRPATAKGLEVGKRRWGRSWTQNGKTPEETERFLSRIDLEYVLPITVEEHLELLRRAGFSVAELFWRSNMQAGFYVIR